MAEAKTPADIAKSWLLNSAFPLWSSLGLQEDGGFVEEISLKGEVVPQPRRAMVQARLLYCFRLAVAFGFKPELSRKILRDGSDHFLRHFSKPDGSFAHSIGTDGKVMDPRPDLYAQAFSLFGLAHAYHVLKEERLKERAKALLAYLLRERRAQGGGFTEVDPGGRITFVSNPHMHLFEAALAWMEFDSDPGWKQLADELAGHCSRSFIDGETGILAEYFSSGWHPLREGGRFVFEPGHHFEWSWLFSVYGELAGKDTGELARHLFHLGERHGICGKRGVVFDEVWSDLQPKKFTSRYWTQCERIKAAIRLGERQASRDAMDVLFRFLETPVKGLCFDHLKEDGTFSDSGPKASYLYHVANALQESIDWGGA